MAARRKAGGSKPRKSGTTAANQATRKSTTSRRKSATSKSSTRRAEGRSSANKKAGRTPVAGQQAGAYEGEERQSDSGALLSDEQVEEVVKRLRSGRKLPTHLFPHLFETAKEYELAYASKMRKADVLAETMAVPLQPVKRFGGAASAAWTNRLILGDNLQVLKHLLELKEEGALMNADGTAGPRLVYLDPPFATGEAWETRRGRIAYTDKVRGAEFIEWLRRRLILMTELLADDGSLIVHLDHRYVHYIKVVLDELLPGNFRNDIVVPRGVKGVQSQFEEIDALALGHYVLLWYSKRSATRYDKLYDEGSKPSRWDTFWLGTDRPTMRYKLFGITPDTGQWRWKREKSLKAIDNYKQYLAEAGDLPIEEYADRIEATTGERPDFLRKGPAGQPQWYRYAKTRRLASDVWDLKTKGSVTGFPTEKHEDLLDRIINWLTAEGDLVLDAFVGSGTTAAVADRLNRRWIGIDSTKFAVYTAQARLLRQWTKGERSGAPFTLDNAGLYDYDTLRGLPWADYKHFVLQLFQCRTHEEEIAGVTFDGFLGDYRVLVHDFKRHTDAGIGEAYVKDLRRICGERLGDRCFIIAPALAVEPYEDYLDVDGTRFFFLRIPYSVIAELHKRAFSELRQPDSAERVNAFIESVGFDFIQPPRVECSYEQLGDQLLLRVRQFESEAYAATPSEADIDDLAMIMVDLDYDGEIFDLDKVLYADALKKDGWKVELDAAAVGEQIMVIYLDIYGNEHRETKRPSDFKAKRSRSKKRPSKTGKRATAAKQSSSAKRATTAKRSRSTKPRAGRKG